MLLAAASWLLPSQACAQAADDATPLSWRWRTHHPADYAATGVFVGVGIATELLHNEPRWTGGIGVDTAFRDAFVLSSFDARRVAARFSDVTVAALITQTAFDSLLAWAAYDAGETAWQLAAMDLQAFSFTLALTGSVKRAAERERPSATACRTEAGYDRRCTQQNATGSFYSGHTSMAFTAAGLTCTHHRRLPLYGGAGDVIACVAAAFGAATVGFERILADRHYLSDVLVGAAVGTLSGAVMPELIHYAWPREGAAAQVSLAPALTPVGGGLQLQGRW